MNLYSAKELSKFEGQKIIMTYEGKSVTILCKEVEQNCIKSNSGREYLIESISEIHLLKPYCIGKRNNPQLSKPYYKMFGQLTKAEIIKNQKCLYGSMEIIQFDSMLEYAKEVEKLSKKGFSIR